MFQSLPIIPKYKMMLVYDIRPGMQEVYYRYIVNEFVPSLNQMQIYITAAWHTAYGDYPLRQLDFVTNSLDLLNTTFDTEDWLELERRLKGFTTHYQTKVVPYRSGFQF